MHHQLLTEPETIQDLEVAAAERLNEAKALVAEGQATGGAYLAGYVAEMVLKMAAFRVNGHLPTTAVYPLLAPALHRARIAYGPNIDYQSYHGVLFWALVLADDRNRLGLATPIARHAVNRAQRINQIWSVNMRYRAGLVAQQDAVLLLNDVGWMHSNRLRLWS
ncbi:MAG: hypothetical protein ABMA64_11840 [Myxococcota bacterium]